MRILAIRGANLASLARDFAVELAAPPLCDAGLFAITGRVGAGKTTLLDAVCLALFDRTPRLSGRGGAPVGDSSEDERDWLASNDVRTVLRRGATEGFAEVDFRGRDSKIYRARWSVHRARRRVEGRLQAQELTLLDVASGQPIGARKTEVLQAIQERLGLNFAQFCRSVLLAQGDFAAFLEAKPAERAELLERMTGTAIYRRLSAAAHERHRSEQTKLQTLADNARDHHPLEAARRRELEIRARQAEERVQVLQQEEAAAQRAWSWHETAERWRQQEADAVHELRAAREAEAKAASRRTALKRVQAVQPLRPRWEALQQAEAEWQQARETSKVAKRAVTDVTTARDAARVSLRETQAALRAGEDPAAVTDWSNLHADGIPLAREFARFGHALRRYCAAAVRVGDLIEARPERADAVEEQSRAVRAAGESLLAARGAQQLTAAAREAARRSARGMPEDDVRRRRTIATRAGALLGRLQAIHAEWRSRVANVKRIDRERARCAERRERVAAVGRESAQRQEALERDLETARAQLRRAETSLDLAAHRAQLRPGEPCPLCGATVHDLADTEHAEACAELRARVRELEREFAGHLKEAGRNLEEQRALHQRLAELDAETAAEQEAVESSQGSWAEAAAESPDWNGPIDGSVEDRLRSAAEAHAAEVAAIESLEEELRMLRDAVSEAETAHLRAVEEAQAAGETLRESERELRRREQALAAVGAELQAAEAARDELASALDPAFAFDRWQTRAATDPEGFLTQCESLAEHGAALRTTESELADARAALREAERAETESARRRDRVAGEWERATGDLDIAPEEVVLSLEKDEDWIRAESEALDEVASAVQRARAVLREREERRREHEDHDRPELGREEARRGLAEVRRRQEDARKNATELRVQLEHDDGIRRWLAELQPKLEAQSEVVALWSTMNELIGSARGDKFQIFAQSLTMDLLVEQANLRLRELARRYRLRRVPGEDMDLVVVDLDMGEAVRSIHTLSGGESFLVSLALALALASLSAQRTRVETLFIDEGFGSLDSQSLETALAALDALQATGCQVGVISHVEGLAERIGARVEVTADGRGASALSIR